MFMCCSQGLLLQLLFAADVSSICFYDAIAIKLWHVNTSIDCTARVWTCHHCCCRVLHLAVLTCVL